MQLLLIRHAKAQPYATSDSARALTEKGIAQSRQVGEFLKKNNLTPNLTLTSPSLRARQTAEIYCKSAGAKSPIIEPWLDCGMHPSTAMEELAAYRDFHTVAITGHEPDFSYLAEWLLDSQAGGIHVKKASIILFSNVHPPSQGAFLELIVPVSSIKEHGA